MATVNVNFQKSVGKIKAMHAVGQPPIGGGFRKINFSYIRFLEEANIPYSRLHDVGGSYGGGRYVDIPNLFRDFDADETDPANYDFAFTDALLEGMAEYHLKPIFRLGVTIENQFHIKAYHIYPPKDFAKWARICEHVIRHYNEGWANGFHYGIEYWEIWNEPDNGAPGQNQMWLGTNEQYYELYDITARHLKACFGDTIKVGGYGACSPRGIFYDPEKYGVNWEKEEPTETGIHRMGFLFGFLDYITEHQSPIDFFSWHSYANVEKTIEMTRFFERTLKKYGFENLETMLNEWNGPHEEIQHGTSYASAQVAAMMCAQQNEKVDMLCFYDARLQASRYAGFFAPYTCELFCTYYSFKAFGQLYAMGTQAECICDTEKMYAVAACGNGKRGLMVTNTTDAHQQVETNFKGATVYLIDEDHHLEQTDWDSQAFTLAKDQVVYIEK